MAWQFERVAGPYAFGEGPVWRGDHLLFTDIRNNRIMKYDPDSGDCVEFRTGTLGANGLTQDAQGRLYACEGDGRRVVVYEEGKDAIVLADRFEGQQLNSPNDIVVDAKGRVWFTDPRFGDRTNMELDHESIFRLDPKDDGTYDITRVTFDTTRPNGLIVTPDMKTLLVAQSDYGPDVKRELRAYPIHDDGTVGDHEVLHNFYPHRAIDGMRLDVDGNIVATAGWTQSGPGPMIYVFAPNGRVLGTHPIPEGISPTNCAFGDNDLSALYVTGNEGSLFRARTKRTGMPVGNN